MEVPAPFRGDAQNVTGANAPEVVCSEFQVAVVRGGLHSPGLPLDAPVLTLAMLAHAFLAVVRADERTRRPAPRTLVPLTCNEFQRLFITLVVQPVHDTAHRLSWSDWRRRHQA